MKADDVRLHHLRGMLARWEAYCPKCGVLVSRWHEHFPLDGEGRYADPMRDRSKDAEYLGLKA